MFNWICPECGRDVPPSASECRFCAERKKAAEAAGSPSSVSPNADTVPAEANPVTANNSPAQPLAQPQPPAQYQPTQYQPQHQPPPQAQPPRPDPQPHYYAPPAQPAYPPPGYPPQKSGLPTWLMAILFALAFIGLGAAIFFGYQYFGKGPRAERAGVTEPAATARTKPSNPLQKYVEVVGIRLVQDARHRPQARFVVVNHSSAELNDLTANVTLWASTSRSEEDSVGTFSFKLSSLGGNESKEMTSPLNTKLKVYELP
jgi:hypothetical protein